MTTEDRPEFKPGDIVDITIRSARVEDWSPYHDELTVQTTANANSDSTTFDLSQAAVTVERVAPPEWPPRPGDIWGTVDGGRWFAAQYFADPDDAKDWEGCTDDAWRVVLVPMAVGPYGDSEGRPDEVRVKVGGHLSLVHREEAGA